MSTRGHPLATVDNSTSHVLRTRPVDRNRRVLLALTVLAIVPADDRAGSVWAMVATVAGAVLLLLAYRALRRAAAKVDAALADELGPRPGERHAVNDAGP